MQEIKEYNISLSPSVENSLDEIYDYISIHFSDSYANSRINDILNGIDTLKIFPEAGFNADEKLGKKIDSEHETRGMPLKKDYLVLYNIDKDNGVVKIAYLFSIKSDYMKLLK
ncbi:hypothetical protein CAC02_10725 [Streptococcus gallolyticus]|uniref:Type II toxin-antitoxin system RelE/ParE family toxin n=1 Tax=Streptococcus gallolyticus TaxID=315405 RepID=A0A368UAI6_9STRE|nr:type II toxin-antitoxin system RelE/ParE family toxin [Streptococcus gallolyticus]RCW15962.1 hypothetical protein CAC02_10725 [Streptococcus gallolyticus]